MKLRKMIVCTMVLVFTMGMLVACSTEELALRNLSNELTKMTNTKPVQSEGTIDLKLETIPQELMEYTEGDSDTITEAMDFFDSSSLSYVIKSDLTNKKLDAAFTVVNKATGEKTPFISVLRNQNITYVKIDDYINVIEKMVTDFRIEEQSNEISEAFNEMFGDIQYIKVTDEEIIDFYVNLIISAGDDEAFADEMALSLEKTMEESLDTELAQQRVDAYNALIDELIQKVYKEYSTDIVKQADNKYTLTLDAGNLGTTLFGFLDYNLDNSQLLGDTLKEYINNLTPEQYSLLVGAYAVNEINKEMVIGQIDDLVEDLTENKEEYKQSLQEGLQMYEMMVKGYIDGSVIQVTKGKETDGSFISDYLLRIKLNDPLTNRTEFDASLTLNETVKEIAPFTLQLPTEKVITFTDLIKKVPKVLSINVPSETYTMINLEESIIRKDYYMELIMIDNHAYIPLKKVVYMFGGEVEWDNSNKKPFTSTDKGRVYFDNIIIEDGKSYIKARDLEEIGYVVNWDSSTSSIIITTE